MTEERNEEEFVTLWRAQPIEPQPISLEIRTEATKFEWFVRRKNMQEYVAGAIVIPVFAWYALRFHVWLGKLGCLAIIAATAFVLLYLHRRGFAASTPTGMDARSLVEFHRAQLVRRRDLARAVWLWYLTPFAPGLTLIMLGMWIQGPAPGRSIVTFHLGLALVATVFALFFVILALMNIIRSNRWQREIDALDGWKRRE
jgi:uncharacterized membrane protein